MSRFELKTAPVKIDGVVHAQVRQMTVREKRRFIDAQKGEKPATGDQLQALVIAMCCIDPKFELSDDLTVMEADQGDEPTDIMGAIGSKIMQISGFPGFKADAEDDAAEPEKKG